MAEWKRLILSGSDAVLNSLIVTGSFINGGEVADSHFTGSFTGSFTGDGSGLTGLPLDSQWTSSAVNLYYDKGNVMIGSPNTSNYALDISASSFRAFRAYSNDAPHEFEMKFDGQNFFHRAYTATNANAEPRWTFTRARGSLHAPLSSSIGDKSLQISISSYRSASLWYENGLYFTSYIRAKTANEYDRNDLNFYVRTSANETSTLDHAFGFDEDGVISFGQYNTGDSILYITGSSGLVTGSGKLTFDGTNFYHKNGTGLQPVHLMNSYDQFPVMLARRANGSEGSETQVLEGDSVFSFQARAYGDTWYGNYPTRIEFYAAEDQTNAARALNIRFRSPLLGTITTATNFEIKASGIIQSPFYGSGNMTATALTKSAAAVIGTYATDGTHTETPIGSNEIIYGDSNGIPTSSGNFTWDGSEFNLIGNVSSSGFVRASSFRSPIGSTVSLGSGNNQALQINSSAETGFGAIQSGYIVNIYTDQHSHTLRTSTDSPNNYFTIHEDSNNRNAWFGNEAGVAIISSSFNSLHIYGNVTGSVFTGSFVGDGSGLTGIITSLPSGLVSSSAQIDHNATTNYAANQHFTQASITTVGTVTAGNVDAILPDGTISSSAQIDGSQITGVVSASYALTASYALNAGGGGGGGESQWTASAANVYYDKGQVAIGTTNFSTYALTVQGRISSSGDIRLGTENTSSFLRMRGSQNIIRARSGTPLIFRQGGTERARFNANTGNFNVVGSVTASAFKGSLSITSSFAGDHSVDGVTTTYTAGATITFGQLVHVTGSGLAIVANASASVAVPTMMMMAETTVSANDSAKFLLTGFARDDSWNWTPGQKLYLSNVTGQMTQSAPSNQNDTVQVVGYAIHADKIYFNPSLDTVVLG